MRAAQRKTHWGQWVKGRARYVGFLRMSDVAARVGTRIEQLSRWTALAEPPATMRKGFDVGLAMALRTDKQTLFEGYLRIGPDHAPLLDAEQLRTLHDQGRSLLTTATAA